jgi:DNA-binding protein H-NS
MTKTYEQVVQQIEALKAEAEGLRRKEVAEVIKKMKQAIAVYGLTAADLGFEDASPANRGGVKVKAPRFSEVGGSSSSKAESRAVRYRDAAGNTWGGKGPRPRWIRSALAAGKTLKDLEA